MTRIALTFALVLVTTWPVQAQRHVHPAPKPTYRQEVNTVKQQQAQIQQLQTQVNQFRSNAPAAPTATPQNVSWTIQQQNALIAQEQQFMQAFQQMQYFMAMQQAQFRPGQFQQPRSAFQPQRQQMYNPYRPQALPRSW